jgi:anti-anti-sigma factor
MQSAERTFAAEGVPLRVVLTEKAATARLVVTGELDHVSADVLGQALDEALAGEAVEVIVDLEYLRFCDAGGVGCFLDSAERLRANGRSLHLENPAANVARVLRILRADFLVRQ